MATPLRNPTRIGLARKSATKPQPQKTGQNAKDPREYCIMPQPFAPIPQQILQSGRRPQSRSDLFLCDGRFLHSPRSKIAAPASPRPGSLLIFAPPSSIFLWDESPVRDRGHVVVSLFLGSLRQLNGFPRHFLVGNQVEQMSNEVQTRAPLIVGAHNMPRCILGIRGFQHLISSVGICIPFAARRQVHRAKFPLPQRILDARLKALLLLLITNF
jgi:hypothetical protein